MCNQNIIVVIVTLSDLSSLDQSTLPGSPIPSSKSLPLLLSAIPSPRPSVAMVTTLSHTPKPGATHPDSNSQNAPVSLQATCPLTNQGLEAVRLVTKSTVVVSMSLITPSTRLRNVCVGVHACMFLVRLPSNNVMYLIRLMSSQVHTSQPIRVPQFVPPRLAPRPACQPQVIPSPPLLRSLLLYST